MRWWEGITDSMDMSLSKLRDIVKDSICQGQYLTSSVKDRTAVLQFMGLQRVRHHLATEQQ